MMKKGQFCGGWLLTDLVVVTLWGALMCRFAAWAYSWIWLMVVVRLGLTFQMERRSAWLLPSAVGFGLAWLAGIGREWVAYPVRRLAYYGLCLIGKQSAAITLFTSPMSHEGSVWTTVLTIMLLGWLIGLPLLVGLLQHRFGEIKWRNKGLQLLVFCYFVGWIVVALWKMWVGWFVGGLGVSVLATIVWSVSHRHHRSIVQLSVDDTSLRRYVLALLLFVVYLLIGVSEITVVKSLALLTLPVIVYVMMCRWESVRPVLTRICFVIVCVSGIYFLALENPSMLRGIGWWIIGFGLTYVVVDSILRNKRIWIALFTVILILVGNPVLMGHNPYVMTGAESIYKSRWLYDAPSGYYIFTERNEEGEEKRGLRDRYGEILPAEYDELLNIDRYGRFVGVLKSPGTLVRHQRYGVYDLIERRFILDPKKVTVTRMVQSGNLTYDLYDEDSRHFTTLILPGIHPELMERLEESRFMPKYENVLGEVSLTWDYGVEGKDEKDETQHAMNAGAERLMNQQRQATTLEFMKVARRDSEYGPVFTAWDNLMMAMTEHLVKVTYGEPFYSMQPLQYCADVREWYEAMKPMADADLEALDVDFNYIDTNGCADSSLYELTEEEKAFFSHHNPREEGGYSLMYDKVLPAYVSWLSGRRIFACNLHPKVRKDFEASTAVQRAFLFKEIKGLEATRNDNIIYDMGL